ncbi:MAG: ECF transporter S component [Clostridia bacterium]|nr:ECF transporter S component [Clostridia bacterium]
MKKAKPSTKIKNLTLLALMTALVVLTEIISANIKFGTFSITLTHIPIVIGASILGPWAGAWLGLSMGVVVLFEPATQGFLLVNFAATVFVVLLKSTLSGFVSGVIYKAIKNKTLSISVSALTCPIVNTAIFIIGSLVFFSPSLAAMAGPGKNVFMFLIVGIIGVNFIIEFLVAAVMIPVIKKVIDICKKMRSDKSYI